MELIEHGKGLECNTGEPPCFACTAQSSRRILKTLYRELGGEITIGSDAHTPDYFWPGFRNAAAS